MLQISPSADANSLIAAVAEVYLDERKWLHYPRAGMEHVRSWFSKDVAAAELDQILFP